MCCIHYYLLVGISASKLKGARWERQRDDADKRKHRLDVSEYAASVVQTRPSWRKLPWRGWSRQTRQER